MGKSDPYLEFAKQNPDGSFTPVHNTEVENGYVISLNSQVRLYLQVVKNNLNPTWKSFEITTQKLCNNDPDRIIKVSWPNLESKVDKTLKFFGGNPGDLL